MFLDQDPLTQPRKVGAPLQGPHQKVLKVRHVWKRDGSPSVIPVLTTVAIRLLAAKMENY